VCAILLPALLAVVPAWPDDTAAEPAPWRVTAEPYFTDEATREEALVLARGEGEKAQVTRSPDDAAGSLPQGPEWTEWAAGGAVAEGVYALRPWAVEAHARLAGLRYDISAQGAGLALADLDSLWAAALVAFQGREAAGDVCLVHGRPAEELRDEAWCAELDGVRQGPEPQWWVRDGGSVTRATLCRSVDGDRAVGEAKVFAGPVEQVCLFADVRVAGSGEVVIVWYLGDRPVIRRNMPVAGNCSITAKLRASGGAGLGAGRYAVEVWSGDGKEARLEFIVAAEAAGG
jgi:hypothetical protein